jgi:hypothetical protein
MSQFRTLYREFLFRVVDLELIAPQGDMTKLLGQFAAFLVFLSLWFALIGVAMSDSRLAPPLRLMAVWTMEHFLIATTHAPRRPLRRAELEFHLPRSPRHFGACAFADPLPNDVPRQSDRRRFGARTHGARPGLRRRPGLALRPRPPIRGLDRALSHLRRRASARSRRVHGSGSRPRSCKHHETRRCSRSRHRSWSRHRCLPKRRPPGLCL